MLRSTTLRKNSGHLLQLLDTRQFFRAFLFSAAKPELWRLWQQEQQSRAFRLDLPGMAAYFHKNARPTSKAHPGHFGHLDSPKHKAGGKSSRKGIPAASFILLREQLRELFALSQCEDPQLRSFALQILLRQPLLYRCEEFLNRRGEIIVPRKFSACVAQLPKNGQIEGVRGLPGPPPDSDSVQARNELDSLERELRKIFPYLLLALDDPEHWIREQYIFDLCAIFPHRMSDQCSSSHEMAVQLPPDSPWHQALTNGGKNQKSEKVRGADEAKDPSWSNSLLQYPSRGSAPVWAFPRSESGFGIQSQDGSAAEEPPLWVELRWKLYRKLLHCSLNDAVYQVRRAATKQIKCDFIDLFQIHRRQLNRTQQRYFVESFELGNSYHRKVAWDILRQLKTGQPENWEDTVEQELLEVKLLHYLDLCGELFVLLSDLAQQSPELPAEFFAHQALQASEQSVTAAVSVDIGRGDGRNGDDTAGNSAVSDARNLAQQDFAWSLCILRRSLQLKQNRFLRLWLQSVLTEATATTAPLLQPKEYWNGVELAAPHFGTTIPASEQSRELGGLAFPVSSAASSLSITGERLRRQLECLDSHSWILLFELVSYSQDAVILSLLSGVLLQRIRELLGVAGKNKLGNGRKQSKLPWHWPELLDIFSELLREQEALNQQKHGALNGSSVRHRQIFAWLKLRTRSIDREVQDLWQGAPQRAESYGRQFGLLLALSAWRLCLSYLPQALYSPILRRYVAEIHSLAERLGRSPHSQGPQGLQRPQERGLPLQPVLTLLLLAMPGLPNSMSPPRSSGLGAAVSKPPGEKYSEQDGKGHDEDEHRALSCGQDYGGVYEAHSERELYSQLLNLACIPYFSSFEALRIALRHFASASYIAELEAELQYQLASWQDAVGGFAARSVRDKRRTKRLVRNQVATRRDHHQVCEQLLCLLLDSGRSYALPVVLEQLHYFSDEQISRYKQLFLQYPRDLLLRLCRRLLARNERAFHQSLLSLAAGLGLSELEAEVRQLLSSQVQGLRDKAYQCLWQLNAHKARQCYRNSQSEYRDKGLRASVCELLRLLPRHFEQLAGVPLHQALRESQGAAREVQAAEILWRTRSPQPLAPGGDFLSGSTSAFHSGLSFGGLSPALARVFHEISGETLLSREKQQDSSGQAGWENVLQMAARQLLFGLIESEGFADDVLHSYLQVARQWRDENSVTLLLHLLKASGQGPQPGQNGKLIAAIWRALGWKVQEGQGLLILLHYLFFSLNYQFGNGKNSEQQRSGDLIKRHLALEDFGFAPFRLPAYLQASGLERANAGNPADPGVHWVRMIDASGLDAAEDQRSWLDRAEVSRFYLFCSLSQKRELLQLRKFFVQLPGRAMRIVRDFLLAMYEPECERAFGWHFSSLAASSRDAYRQADDAKASSSRHRHTAELPGSEHYTLWQFARDFHRRENAALREHCRRLCVDLLEQNGYINDIVAMLKQSRRSLFGLPGTGGYLLSTLRGNWPGLNANNESGAELDERQAKLRFQHQKLQLLMVLALCRTEMSYIGITLFQRDTRLALREYALAELQGLLLRAAHEDSTGPRQAKQERQVFADNEEPVSLDLAEEEYGPPEHSLNLDETGEPEASDAAEGDESATMAEQIASQSVQGARTAGANTFYGQARQPWRDIRARLGREDICRKDWQQARHYLARHPIADYELLLDFSLHKNPANP